MVVLCAVNMYCFQWLINKAALTYGKAGKSQVENPSRRRKVESWRHQAVIKEARHVENEVMPQPCVNTNINRNGII